MDLLKLKDKKAIMMVLQTSTHISFFLYIIPKSSPQGIKTIIQTAKRMKSWPNHYEGALEPIQPCRML